MSKGGQQQPSGQNSMDILYISAFFVLLAVALWYTQHAAIVRLYYALKIKEINVILWCINWLTLNAQSLISYIHDNFGMEILANPVELINAQAEMLSVDYEQVTLSEMWGNIQIVGYYFIYPKILLAAIMIIYLFFFSLGAKFNISFSMESLRAKDAGLWPYITPVVGTNLVDVSLDSGVWGMALRPLEFAEKYNILKHSNKGGQPTISVNEAVASKVFAMQMGPLWDGIDSLPPYAQALFAIFAAKAEKDTAGANKLLKQIAVSAKKGSKLNFAGTRELLIKHISKSKAVGRAVSPHAYIYTVMASMLVAARTDGVIANSEFLWLKRVDRGLWYMLASVGRQTPFPEVSGPFAHWIVEKRLRRPLKVPFVKEAVVGLVQAIAEIKYNPDGY